MRTLLCGLMVASVVALAAGTASAQRQPGGGLGGFGGFGPQTVTAQVMTNAELQKDLKITDDQKDKFKAIAEKQAEASKKMREAFGGGGGRPDMEKLRELREESQKIQAEATKLLDESLTSDQKKRIKQIETQQLGMRAFSNVKIVLTLKISLEQYSKIEDIMADANKQLGELGGFGGFGGGRPGAQPDADARKKRAEITDKAMEKISATLSEDQRKAWDELVGEKFDLSKLNTGFGGAGFGGGRPPQPNP